MRYQAHQYLPPYPPSCCKDGIWTKDERPYSWSPPEEGEHWSHGKWVCDLCSGIHRARSGSKASAADKWSVVLTPAQEKWAVDRGTATYERNVGRKDAHGFRGTPEQAKKVHVQSSLSETALGVMTKRRPSTVTVPGPWPDVGELFVRATAVPSGAMLLHRPGPDGQECDGTADVRGVYVLMVGEDARWRAAGWTLSEDGLKKAEWAPMRQDRPCWWLSQGLLNPMDTLPSDTEAKMYRENGDAR